MKNYLLLLLISTVGYLNKQGTLSKLTVRVENLNAEGGKLMVGIYDNDDDFLKNAAYGSSTKVTGSTINVFFEHVKPGSYAVSIFQDINENGELDTNFLGIPTEPYAFGNNAKGMFGPPDFDDCIVEVKGANTEATISF